MHPKTDFSLHNLPYGVFSRLEAPDDRRIGVAIGDQVLDINSCIQSGLLSLPLATRGGTKEIVFESLLWFRPEGVA